MASSGQQLANLDAELDGLVSPTSSDVYSLSRDYDSDLVAASAVGRAINGGGGGSDVVLVNSKSITSAQLLDLHNTSVELLPAPGGRLYYVLQNMVLHYRFVTTPYTGNVQNALTIGFGPDLTAVVANPLVLPLSLSSGTGNLFTHTEDYYVSSPVTVDQQSALNYITPASAIEDKAIGIGIDPSFVVALEDGDGTLTVRTFYSLIDGAP